MRGCGRGQQKSGQQRVRARRRGARGRRRLQARHQWLRPHRHRARGRLQRPRRATRRSSAASGRPRARARRRQSRSFRDGSLCATGAMDGAAAATTEETEGVCDALGFPVPAELVPAYTAAQDALRARDRRLTGLWHSTMKRIHPNDSEPLPDSVFLFLFSPALFFQSTRMRCGNVFMCSPIHGVL